MIRFFIDTNIKYIGQLFKQCFFLPVGTLRMRKKMCYGLLARESDEFPPPDRVEYWLLKETKKTVL